MGKRVNPKDNRNRAKKKVKKFINIKNLIIVIGIVTFIVGGVYSGYKKLEATDAQMTYKEFWEQVDAGNIEQVRQITSETYMTVTDKEGTTYKVVDPGYDDFRKDMLEHGVAVQVTDSTFSDVAFSLITTLPIQIAMYAFLVHICFSNFITSGNMFKVLKPEDVVTFDDIAGMSETKEEVKFAITQLKNASKLESLDARPCKGIILSGPPGTGKTMLARAIAGESGVPMISCSGSDFIEMFVGLGAARVRQLWDLAELNAPCVVFIDEIDCLGRRRSGGQNSENNQTLNALLQKMDGMERSKGIFVVGATNRIDDLDQALLRPGRFDKQLYVGKPRTKKDRDEITEIYLKNKKKEPDVTVENVSSSLRGFSGAEIAQTLNEAVMISLMDNRDGVIQLQDVNKAAMKLIAHGVAVGHTSEKDRLISAVHEAGHAVENILVGNKVAKVSIESYSSGIGGYTMENTDKKDDNSFMMKSDILNNIKVMLAGMVSEDIYFGEHSTGCSNDIEKASVLAFGLINSFAMDNKNIINREAITVQGVRISESKDIMDKANELMNKLKDEVNTELKNHKEEIRLLVKKLLTDEVVTDYSFEKLKNTELSGDDLDVDESA